MSLLTNIFRSNFFIRLRSWEYWPFGVLQAPLFLYWLWLSLKARSLVFFTASNPGILMGGMFGESKFEVLEKIPDALKPRTFLAKHPASADEILRRMFENKMQLPVIFKPDIGERGWKVKRITSLSDIEDYLVDIRMDFLVQDFVDLPLEFGVAYKRYPNQSAGQVTSIVGKEMLSVKGDGHTTLRDLILRKDRSKLQWETLKVQYRDRLDAIIPRGERVELVSIGNHCLGTKFLNANHLITDELSKSFDKISCQIEGFYFGRFDLRTRSHEDLEKGNVLVMELNGCGAEPAHIYQPGFSLGEAIRVLFRHWRDLYEISVANHDRGVEYLSFREAKAIYKNFRAVTA